MQKIFYNQIRKPHSRRRYYVIAIGLLLLCVLTGFIFIKQNLLKISPPAPLPTAINPNFLTQVNNCFIPAAAVYGYTLRITAGFRSIADQTQMYDQGRTVNGHIVTEAPPGHSLHNYGYAVDVVDRYRGYNINWTQLVKIAAYCSLESGGVGDLPHFEERAGLTTDQFAAGMRPPALTLPCTIMAERTATSSPMTLKDLTACGAPKF
ncbi:MAG: M15 family metallopeptidase [Patescibacteria group bacterium]|nr:M15 family metallopeptidase [Patescibacteria group bacterium]